MFTSWDVDLFCTILQMTSHHIRQWLLTPEDTHTPNQSSLLSSRMFLCFLSSFTSISDGVLHLRSKGFWNATSLPTLKLTSSSPVVSYLSKSKIFLFLPLTQFPGSSFLSLPTWARPVNFIRKIDLISYTITPSSSIKSFLPAFYICFVPNVPSSLTCPLHA